MASESEKSTYPAAGEASDFRDRTGRAHRAWPKSRSGGGRTLLEKRLRSENRADAPFSLPWSIGELAELYPDVRTVMLHMGHGHGVYIQAAINTTKPYDNIILETSGMPMHTKRKEAVETIGENRVVYGSDIPFHHSSVELQRVKMTNLAEHQLQLVLHDNAASLPL